MSPVTDGDRCLPGGVLMVSLPSLSTDMPLRVMVRWTRTILAGKDRIHGIALAATGQAPERTPQGTPPEGPKWAPRPGGPRGARGGKFPAPGPGAPRAPRGPPGGQNRAPGGPQNGPLFGAYIYTICTRKGGPGGVPPGCTGDPRGPPGPRGAKKCTFFWVFNNSPSRDSFGPFFGPPRDPPKWGYPGQGRSIGHPVGYRDVPSLQL